ncbi:MAG: 3D domain-containing protein [Paenibacillaceae bacterium]
MKLLNLVLGVIIGIGLILNQPTAAAPTAIVKTVVETRIVYKSEFIKVNQTEPVEMMVTAYTAGPESTGKRQGMKGYGITFTGTQAKIGVCAVDPTYIPIGSSLYVESYGYCHAEDIGGKIKGNHIDVFIPDLQGALKFGRENRKVWILNNFGEE